MQVPLRHGVPTEADPGAPADERARRFGHASQVRMYGDDVADLLLAGRSLVQGL